MAKLRQYQLIENVLLGSDRRTVAQSMEGVGHHAVSTGKGNVSWLDTRKANYSISRSTPTGQWSDPASFGQMKASRTRRMAVGEAST